MRRILSLFLLTILFGGHLSAQVMVQGQPHPTAKHVPTKAESHLKSDQNFTFSNVKFWVGTGSNRAALVIEWHDGKQPDALVWGYRWDGEASGHDMIVAVAKADPRLLLLTQQTGNMGYTICGIGYSDQSLDVNYDLKGAIANPEKSLFRFEPPFPALSPQKSVPASPAEDAASAIQSGLQTGIIYHPFTEALYGYPSYDYDFWSCDAGSGHWRSGWYYGYWSYWTGNSVGSLSYSGLGATSRQLTDGSWDAWSFQGDMGSSMGGEPLGDRFLAAPKPGDPLPDPSDPIDPVDPVDPPTPPAPVEPETIIPEITTGTTEVTFSFPKVTNTSYYIARIYKKEKDKETLFLNAQTTGDGTIIAITRSSNDQVNIKISRLDEGSEYRAEIDAIKESSSEKSEIIGKANISFKTEGDSSTAIQTLSADAAKVYYASGNLHLLNLQGYTCRIITLNGQLVHSMRVSSERTFLPISLSNGIYILMAQKQRESKTFKFIITNTK